MGGGKKRQISPPQAPDHTVGCSDNVYSYFRETQPSGTSLPANCLIWSHPQLGSSQPTPETAPPTKASTQQETAKGQVGGREETEKLNFFFFFLTVLVHHPSKRMTWSVLGVCQHRCRVQGTALSWELLLMLPSQENHKTEEGQPRCPGENRLKLSLSERIRDWEPLPRVHLGDICKNFCVHPESHACK